MPRGSRIPAVPRPSTTVRFSSLVADTITHLAALNRSSHTVLSYDIAYREFATYLSTRQLTDDAQHFTEARILGFMAWLHHHRADNTWASMEDWAIPRPRRVIPALMTTSASFDQKLRNAGSQDPPAPPVPPSP